MRRSAHTSGSVRATTAKARRRDLARQAISPLLASGVLLSAEFAEVAHGQEVIADHTRVQEAVTLTNAWLEAELAYESIPGMSVAIVYDQELVWSADYGYADVESRIPITPGTLYNACSIAKLFTATGAMQLRDEGLLELDDPVDTHLPWFEVTNPLPERRSVTIENLLTHTSGLPRDLPYSYWSSPDRSFPTREDVIAGLESLQLRWPAGDQFGYSNVGMTLLGEIVAAVSGVPVAEYMNQRVFEPLGMVDSSIDSSEDDVDRDLASGYGQLRRDGTRAKVPAYRVRALSPAAGLITTRNDLAKFASWQFRVLAGGENAVLDPATLRSMHQVQWMQSNGWTRSGYGYQSWAENDRHFVGHAGACPGYESKLLLRPSEKIAIVALTNSQGPDVDGYAQRLYDIFVPGIRAALASGAGSSPLTPATRHIGLYERPLGGELLVVSWQNDLALLRLPTADPLAAMERFEPIGQNMYRRTGTSGPQADLLSFEEDETGRMLMWRDHQYSIRQQ